MNGSVAAVACRFGLEPRQVPYLWRCTDCDARVLVPYPRWRLRYLLDFTMGWYGILNRAKPAGWGVTLSRASDDSIMVAHLCPACLKAGAEVAPPAPVATFADVKDALRRRT